MTQTDKPNHVPPHDGRGASRRARLCLFLSALATASLAPLAIAHAADAEALLKEGKQLVADKKYDEACPKIAEAYKLSPSPATLLDLALCHEKQGKLATAWGEMLDAETDARKAGRADIETRARANSKAIEPKLPRVTVSVATNTPGIEIAIDGQKIDLGALGKGRPVDPGEHKIVASAPGRKAWETTISLKQAERKSVVVPALAEDPNAASAPDKPAGGESNAGAQAGGTTPTNPTPGGGAAGDTKPKEKPEEPDDGKGPIHRAKRLVVDVGAFGGGQLFLGGGSVDALSALTYEYRITYPLGGEAAEYKACDASACYATVDPAIGVPVGGQVFVGYALSEKLHVGGRFFGSYLVTGGYSLLVGPALSVRVNDRLWIGGTLAVGFGGQNATINGARGEVPSEWAELNGGDEVDLLLSRTIPEENETGFGFSFGAAVEVSYTLAEFGKGKSITTGSLVASAWPTFLKTWDGFAIALPIGVGYRFH
ncbi:hypothetical protein [Polyangium sp. y55x31]|uniref:hypothetical protein n=1 Tax=Polyangium sp. y55x31 TaxID=3042688 RepID=UPI0024832904|nr:hypothetical protein [Polyangium sp. y55x31]MDI1475272.1 hypothetical protein [Polyangium sp. y55x31]